MSGDFNQGFTVYPEAGVGSSADPIVNGVGYALYIYAANSTAIIDFTGEPIVGDFDFNVEFSPNGGPSQIDNNGWNLLGNPYASSINWEDDVNWTKTNVEDGIYVTDEENGVFASCANGVCVNGGTGLIASGQAFWVKADGINPAMTISEGAKSTANDMTFFRVADPIENVLRMTLSSSSKEDEMAIRIDDRGTAGYDKKYDTYSVAGILPHPDPQDIISLASLSSEGHRLAINTLAANGCEISVPLSVQGTVGHMYTVNAKDFGAIGMQYTVELIDQVADKTVILQEGDSYEFVLEEEESNRFTLRLSSMAGAPELTYENQELKTDRNNVTWLFNGQPMTGVEGSTFKPERSGKYGVEYAAGGCVLRTEIDVVVPGMGFMSYFSVAPNPMLNTLNLTSYTDAFDMSQISLIDIQGRVFMAKEMQFMPGTYEFDVSNLPAGVYIIKIASDDTILTHRLIKQ